MEKILFKLKKGDYLTDGFRTVVLLHDVEEIIRDFLSEYKDKEEDLFSVLMSEPGSFSSRLPWFSKESTSLNPAYEYVGSKYKPFSQVENWDSVYPLFAKKVNTEKGIKISNAEYNDILRSLMREFGFKTESYGRSCFKTRTGVKYLTNNKPKTVQAYYIDALYPEQTGWKEINIWDISDVEGAVKRCEEEAKRQELEKVESVLLSASKDGKISIVEYQAGNCGNMPVHPDWEEIWSVRTACTSDHRQGYGHTYLGVFLHKGTKGVVTLSLPDQYKGRFIGKQGSNIKSLQEKYNIRIKLL